MVGPIGMGLAAMVAALGALLVVAGARGVLSNPIASASARRNEGLDHIALRLGLGLAGFVGVFALTRWPVAAMYFGLGGFFLPTLATAKRKRKEAIDRVEAIAVWAESLRDTMSASAGVQEALRTTASIAPAPIRTEVRDLALRLQHSSVISALRQFAVDMRHPLADLVVASLIMAMARQAGSLQDVLAMTAKGARDSASLWRHVESGRAKVYAQARLAGWISLILVTFFVVFRRDFLEPFDSFTGQIALFVVCGAFFGSGAALHHMSRSVAPRRLFQGIEQFTDVTRSDADQEAGR